MKSDLTKILIILKSESELLTNAAKDITDLIAYSTFNDMEFKIEGTIQISLVPIKKQNQLLKQYCLKDIILYQVKPTINDTKI
jgi:hypothetical protein